MIEKHVAALQMQRLSGLDYFPRSENSGSALNELVLALQAAENEFIAAHVVNAWLQEQTQSPKPAELRRLCWDENARREDNRKNPAKGCPICKGVGMIIVSQGVSRLDGRTYTGAKDCECRREAIERDRAAHAK